MYYVNPIHPVREVRPKGAKFISTSCFVFSYLRVFVIDFGWFFNRAGPNISYDKNGKAIQGDFLFTNTKGCDEN